MPMTKSVSQYPTSKVAVTLCTFAFLCLLDKLRLTFSFPDLHVHTPSTGSGRPSHYESGSVSFTRSNASDGVSGTRNRLSHLHTLALQTDPTEYLPVTYQPFVFPRTHHTAIVMNFLIHTHVLWTLEEPLNPRLAFSVVPTFPTGHAQCGLSFVSYLSHMHLNILLRITRHFTLSPSLFLFLVFFSVCL